MPSITELQDIIDEKGPSTASKAGSKGFLKAAGRLAGPAFMALMIYQMLAEPAAARRRNLEGSLANRGLDPLDPDFTDYAGEQKKSSDFLRLAKPRPYQPSEKLMGLIAGRERQLQEIRTPQRKSLSQVMGEMGVYR